MSTLPARGNADFTRLARVRIVLSHPSHPGNIGAAARAMKTMGLARLALVNPRRFPDPAADALATGAVDVLASAHVCGSLDEALAGATLAIALTARRRDLSPTALDAREAGALAVREAAAGDVAFVFGNETTGLSNDEVLRCQRVVHIPTDPAYASLNLAAAVQIVAYEVRMAALGPRERNEERFEAATHEAVEHFYAHLERSIVASGFLNPAQPGRMMERLRRLFGRTRLEAVEIDILRGMLTAWDARGAQQKNS